MPLWNNCFDLKCILSQSAIWIYKSCEAATFLVWFICYLSFLIALYQENKSFLYNEIHIWNRLQITNEVLFNKIVSQCYLFPSNIPHDSPLQNQMDKKKLFLLNSATKEKAFRLKYAFYKHSFACVYPAPAHTARKY